MAVGREYDMRTEQLSIDFGVTDEQSCIMCHLSSNCAGCCKKCRNPSCSGQMCSIPFAKDETARWNTWMYLVRTFFPELKKFIPKKFIRAYRL